MAPGRLQLTFPSPEYMMELYGLVQVQDQAQACPDLDLSDWTSLGHTWGSPSIGDRDHRLVENFYPHPSMVDETDLLSVHPTGISVPGSHGM